MSQNVPLDALLEFPCDYLFKAFGSGDDTEAFVAAVHAAVTAVVVVPLDAIKVRPSRTGKYLCVTVLVRLHSVGELQAVYAGLQKVEGLLYLL